MQTPSTAHRTPAPTPRWYAPESVWSQRASLLVIAFGVLAIWAPGAPYSSFVPWNLDFTAIGGWVGDPLRIALSYAVLLAGLLWPFWIRRHGGATDPMGSLEDQIAWPVLSGTALVFAFAQITVFLLEQQYVRAGFNGETVFSLTVAAIVMLIEAGRRSYKLASDAFKIAPEGTVTTGTPPPTGPASPPVGAQPPVQPPSVSPTPAGPTCGACGATSVGGAVYCPRCGTRMAPNGIGYT